MKIAVLTNNDLGVYAINELIEQSLLVSVACPEFLHSDLSDTLQLLQSRNIGFATIRKDNLENDLKNWLNEYQPDFVFIYTFPYIIPGSVLNSGVDFYNFHFALLPKYRGAEPIFWEFVNREKYGGISVFKVTADLDSGPLLLERKLEISEYETHGMHLSKLTYLAKSVSDDLVRILINNELRFTDQNDEDKNYWKKPVFESTVIKWDTMTADQITTLVRACNPWNKGAITWINGIEMRILEAGIIGAAELEADAGTIAHLSRENGLQIYTTDKKLVLVTVIYMREGYMTALNLLNFGVKEGTKFETMLQ